ncbi:unnamed protein product [Parnassius apollo]|uniref:(apollo) hypothetical protein n=1 Tax=Parnassius apollo TaxID=110799 RepID=A0A8S3Y0I1_PARAO|nr:unnamed protein product [Parnassius apollo]
MNNLKLEVTNNLIRSKSLSSLEFLDNVSNGLKVFQQHLVQYKDNCDRSHASDNELEWEESFGEEPEYLIYEKINNSALNSTQDVESICTLESKIEKLNDLLLEQQKLLVGIKEDIKGSLLNGAIDESKTALADQSFEDLTLKDLIRSTLKEIIPMKFEDNNDRAKSLFDAIEQKHTRCLDQGIKDALTEFLQDDALKERIVSATKQCVKDVIRSCFSQSFSTSYLPLLERSHRHLLRQVTKILEDSFKELEENSTMFTKSVHKTSKTLRKALERHQSLLEEADHNINLTKHLQRSLQEILQKELKEWRENLYQVLLMPEHNEHDNSEDNVSSPSTSNYTPISPPQPADPERSIIEQLMKSAEVNKLIKEGNVNGSFEKALSSSDLSLVMAACRAADPVKVFSPPCKLRQSVLLSLIQQLATDMVHDTQLKCRYLEDAIINLNTLDSVTRSHLPMVVAEVRKHLTHFLLSYPSHVASRRVTLIIMAADYLLKSYD